MIIYTKLWLLLKEREMKKTDLLKVISSATLAKLGKNETVSSKVLSQICDFLKCQPGDIMENVTKEDIAKTGSEVNNQINQMLELLTTITGQTKEELLQEFMDDLPALVEKIKRGEKDILGISEMMKDEG